MQSASTLFRDTLKSGMDFHPTVHPSNMNVGPPSRSSGRGCLVQRLYCRRTDCKPGQKFSVSACRKSSKRGAFSANECCRARQPQRLRLTKSHQQRERLRSNQVQGVAQVESVGAHWGVDCERARMSFFDLDEV